MSGSDKILMEFSREHGRWLRAEAKRRGVSIVDVVRAFIDAEMRRESARSLRRSRSTQGWEDPARGAI